MPTNYLIDSHCHIHDTEDFNSTSEEILERAHTRGVQQVVVIGTSHEDSLRARDFAKAHEEVYWSYGVHPSEAPWTNQDFDFDTLPVAIGEVGLDYHCQPYERNEQIKLFEQMLDLAKRHDLPLIFHVREAFSDFLPIVDNQHIKRAVVHSFSDNHQNLEEVLARGFYVGVNGLATFAPIPLPPLEKMLLETDAPYLTPVPKRGTINEPGNIADIAGFLSKKLGVSSEEVARKTSENVRELFRIKQPIIRS